MPKKVGQNPVENLIDKDGECTLGRKKYASFHLGLTTSSIRLLKRELSPYFGPFHVTNAFFA